MNVQCCENCFLEPSIRNYIHKIGLVSKEPCEYCGSIEMPSVEVSTLRELFEPVIQKHYLTCDNLSQYRHEDPGNGEDLVTLLDSDFGVFSEEVEDSCELLNDILNLDRDQCEPEMDPRDSWFRIDDDWGYRSPEEEHDEALSTLTDAIETHGSGITILLSRKRLPAEVGYACADILNALTHSSLKAGELLWRARVGNWDDVEQIKAPPSHCAKPGRCSLGGQPVLYVASSRDTAVSEVRPSKRDIVSVAQFKLKYDVKICDLLSVPVVASPFTEFDAYCLELRRKALADTLGQALAKPIRPDEEPREYLVTQVLCYLIFDKGFDGIRYHSSQHDGGVNMVFLEPEIAEPVATSFSHVTVKAVSYSIGEGQ